MGYKIEPNRNINRFNAWKKRQDWFIARIGKTVYRGTIKCNCPSCVRGHIHGVLILDMDHALYLHAVEGEMGLRYSDSKYPQ